MENNPIYKFVNKVDLKDFDNIELVDYDYDKPTLLFTDDSDAIVTLFKRLCRRLKLKQYFNIVTVSKYDAIFKILKTLNSDDKFKIDFAIVDITFSSYINVNTNSYNLNGVQLVNVLKSLNPELKYRFITGHRISKKATNNYFKEFEEFSNDNLLDYIEYKNKPLSTNKELLITLFKGTKYDKLFS